MIEGGVYNYVVLTSQPIVINIFDSENVPKCKN